MKRFLCLLLVALMISPVALADTDYSAMSTEELHKIIDLARNELFRREQHFEDGQKTVLIDLDEITLYLTGEKKTSGKYLYYDAILINNSDKEVSVTIDDCYINGWASFGMAMGSLNAGKKMKGDITFGFGNAEISSYEEIETLEFVLSYWFDNNISSRVKLQFSVSFPGNGF